MAQVTSDHRSRALVAMGLFIFLGSSLCLGQGGSSTVILPSLDIYFGMPPSELPGALPVLLKLNPHTGTLADTAWLAPGSGNALRGTDTVDLMSRNARYKAKPWDLWWYGDGMERYVVIPANQPDIIISFDFYAGRLFQVGVYGEGDSLLNELDDRLDLVAGSSRSDALKAFFGPIDGDHRSTAQVTHFAETKPIEGKLPIRYFLRRPTPLDDLHLSLWDPRSDERMPSWCGNDHRHATWKGFSKHLARLQRKHVREAKREALADQ